MHRYSLETSIKRVFGSQVDPYITNVTMSGGQTRSRRDFGHPYGRVDRTKSSIGATAADWIDNAYARGAWDLIRGAGSPFYPGEMNWTRFHRACLLAICCLLR